MKILLTTILLFSFTLPSFADVFTKTGNFVGGAAAGAITGANINKKDFTAKRTIFHITWATALFAINPLLGWTYTGASALVSGIARTETGDYKETQKIK